MLKNLTDLRKEKKTGMFPCLKRFNVFVKLKSPLNVNLKSWQVVCGYFVKA